MTLSSTPVGLPDLQLDPGGPFGIYVHVPFCFIKCGYCDFNTYTPAELGGVNPDAWLQVLRGSVALNKLPLTAGDGVAVSGEEGLAVRADAPSEVMLFDLA